jgi:aminoglycoside phosphotransferase
VSASLRVTTAMFRKGWATGEVLPEVEIPTDPALPQLATLLDGGAMGPILADALPDKFGDGCSGSGRCRVAGVRYRPGRECLVSYALDGAGAGERGQLDTPIACAKVTAEDLAKTRLAKRMTAARDHGTSFAYLPDRGMVVTAFPDDLRVHGLHRLVETDHLRAVIRSAFDCPDVDLERAEDGSPRASIVSYRPERSCLLRCVIQRPTHGKHDNQVVYARLYRDHRGAVIHRAMTALWDEMARAPGLLSVAEPLGYEPGARILFQSAVGGNPLGDMAQGDAFLDHIGQVARSLAALHRSPLSLERRRFLEDELDWIELMARGVLGVRREAGQRLARILDRLQRTAPREQDEPRCLIHGDFSMNQVMAEPDLVSLIDFDDVAMGDPHADLGTFLARLEGRVSDNSLKRSAAERFRRDYEAAATRSLVMDRVVWYQALGFVRLALSALAQLKPGWPSRVDGHLHRAETLIDE